jgi:HAD superfamily hydrolase (TIGR01509 family)
MAGRHRNTRSDGDGRPRTGPAAEGDGAEPRGAETAAVAAGRDGTLYIFDMGGVVSLDSGFERRIAASLDMAPRRLYALTDQEFRDLTAGRISLEEFWRRVEAKTGLPIREDLFQTHFHPRLNRRVVRLINRLRRTNRVVAGTNTVETHYRIHRQAGHYDLFDRVYASFRMGVAKPDPEFFRYILAQEKRPAGECVFVDDREDNVEAAARLGISALRYRGAARLERDIASLGPEHPAAVGVSDSDPKRRGAAASANDSEPRGAAPGGDSPGGSSGPTAG